jgi:riboflavin kinase/FMN adenylyltransferase
MLAEELNCACAVLTFEPHPADFFKGPNTIFRLTPRDAKAKALKQLGIDGMIVITFDKDLASLPAEAFIAEILVRRLRVRVVVAGYDFHFGAGRSGSPAVLKEAGKRAMVFLSRSSNGWPPTRRIRLLPRPRRESPSRQAMSRLPRAC